MEEEWRQIPGYSGRYLVSNLGRVASMPNKANSVPHLLKLRPKGTGYVNVVLSDKNTRKEVSVHRLVAMAFIPNDANLPQVNHKNEIKDDNRVENLEWCTAEYNANYGHRNVRRKPVIQTKDGKMVARHESTRLAAKAVGVDYTSIVRCCNGERRTAAGFEWRYESA